jgi:hypothetical protein
MHSKCIPNVAPSHCLDDILRCGAYGTLAMAYHEINIATSKHQGTVLEVLMHCTYSWAAFAHKPACLVMNNGSGQAP